MDPATLLTALRPCLAAAGITRVANVTGLDTLGIPVTVVTRPNSRSLSVSQGKGITLDAARVSGIMESLEQFHAENIRQPLVLGSYHDLRQARRVVDVYRLPRTPRALDEWQRMLWITAVECGTEQEVLVPFELVHLDMTEPLPEGSGYFPISSNGLASGAELVEAICHGIWELTERDALALFYEQTSLVQSQRRIRADSVDDACCRDLLDRLKATATGVAIWDMTTDIGIPVFMCAIGEREFEPLHIIGMARGYGCHPDRSVALRRALTEAAQGRLTRIAGSRDDIQRGDFDAIRSREALIRHLEHVAQERYANRQFAHVASRSFESLELALEWSRSRLRASGLSEPMYVDLSSGEFPMRVARSIVVGLEGFPDNPDYVPGDRARAVANGRAA